MRGRSWLAVVLAFAVLGGGCAGVRDGWRRLGLDNPPVDGGRVDEERVNTKRDIVLTSFKVRGVMVVMPSGRSARKLAFVWRRAIDDIDKTGAVDIITVRNAAGIVQAQLRIDNNGARLATAARNKQAKDAKTLMTEVFGLPLPLRLLGDFLGGGDNMQLQMHLRESLDGEMRALGWRARFGAMDAEGLPLRFGADGGGGSVDIVITRRQ